MLLLFSDPFFIHRQLMNPDWRLESSLGVIFDHRALAHAQLLMQHRVTRIFVQPVQKLLLLMNIMLRVNGIPRLIQVY